MELRVSTWLQLQEALFDSSWQPSLGRFRSNFVFRGTPRASHGLETSLQTGGFEAHERHLLTSFRKYALRNAVHGDWVWNWLSLAKHHGLPTRLLDWTYSPYVAMHFATHDPRHFGEDGAIWCVDYRRTNELLPKELKKVSEAEDVNILTTEMLNRVATSLQDSAFSTVPRLAVFLGGFLLLLPWMLSRLMSYTTSLFGDLGRYAR